MAEDLQAVRRGPAPSGNIRIGGVEYAPVESTRVDDPEPLPASVNAPLNPNQDAQPAQSVLWSNRRPLEAGALRGALFATIGLLITGVITILQNQTGVLPEWWPAAFTPITIAVLRVWESVFDDRATVAP